MKKLNLNGKPVVITAFLLLAIGLSGCLGLVPNYHVSSDPTLSQGEGAGSYN